MTERLLNLTYEVELKPGEKFVLPEGMAEQLGPGKWIVRISPATLVKSSLTHGYEAFLRSYGPEDEGLYDDYPVEHLGTGHD
jgi:hypothetical protein